MPYCGKSAVLNFRQHDSLASPTVTHAQSYEYQKKTPINYCQQRNLLVLNPAYSLLKDRIAKRLYFPLHIHSCFMFCPQFVVTYCNKERQALLKKRCRLKTKDKRLLTKQDGWEILRQSNNMTSLVAPIDQSSVVF